MKRADDACARERDRGAPADLRRRAPEQNRSRPWQPTPARPACAARHASVRRRDRSRPTTRIPVAILPTVWPPSVVKTQKYEPFTISRNSASGKNRDRLPGRERQACNLEREVDDDRIDRQQDEVIDDGGDDTPDRSTDFDLEARRRAPTRGSRGERCRGPRQDCDGVLAKPEHRIGSVGTALVAPASARYGAWAYPAYGERTAAAAARPAL